MAIKGVFVRAIPNNGPTAGYPEQNTKILEGLRKKYEIITYESLENAAYQMTHDDKKRCSDVSFMITNIPYTVQTPVVAAIKAEKIRERLENLVGEERKKECNRISEENEFNAYEEAFECLRKLKEAFPKMKIIAYTAAHDNVRRKVYDDKLVFRVHQRNHRSGPVWEKVNLIHGVESALEGWQGCE
ncbi:hypothetical protein KY338_01815 [Candidatus Woesearchaeota archaeon]|nr:hypothetical protein [Candidatus Woesearchaeota archaeon]MBW3005985.1 hypothetical protein [Candidatus Woesearchaeota archaeon]